MNNLIEFFETLIGFDFPVNEPLFMALAVIFGFLIVYDVIHIVFSSVFSFIYKF